VAPPQRRNARASRAAEKRVCVSEVVFSKAGKRKYAPCSFLARSPARQIPAVKLFWCEASLAARVAGVGIHRAPCFEGRCGFLAVTLPYTWHGPVGRGDEGTE